MSAVDLSRVKPHLSIEGSEHDALVQTYIDSAEAFVGRHLRRDMVTDFPDGWPDDIQQAVCLMVASAFYNREDGAESAKDGVPKMALDYLASYRVFT